MYHTKQDPQSLEVNVKTQLEALFIGVVMHETSLVDYAHTKKLIGYTGGYSYTTLSTMQRNIDTVKRMFPALHAEFRTILMGRVHKSRKERKNLFYICDEYVNKFATLRLFTYNEVETVLSRYYMLDTQ